MLHIEYIAGFIDGEGCLTISSQSKRRLSTPNGYAAYLTVANTDRSILDSIATWMESQGAKVLVRSMSGRRRRQCYQLIVYGNSLKCIVPKLYQYLRVKKEQARVILEYLETMPGGNRPIGEAVREKRAELMGYIQWLNQGRP